MEKVLEFVVLLRACTRNRGLRKGARLHVEILRNGLLAECSDALVTMYAKCGALGEAKELLDMHKSRDVLTWTALIAGYAQKGHGQNALDYYERMQHEGLSPDAVTYACILKACGSIRAADKGEQFHDEIAKQGLLGNNMVLGTALLDMYAKCGALAKAQRVLQDLSSRNVISWNAIIAGYAECGEGEQALNCLQQMQCDGVSPNAVTYTCILKACGSIKAADKGEEIHDEIAKRGLLQSDMVLSTALIDMYAKCGALAKAQILLEELPIRNVISWTALISGYTEHGKGEQALKCFEQMEREGIFPNLATFVCILKACGSIRAVEIGETIHDKITKEGLLGNDIFLGTALVDMYAKCGVLPKAQQVLEELPVRSVCSWNALISGFAEQGDCQQALNCFEQMQCEGITPNAATFISILKACGSTSAAKQREKIHDEIVKHGLLKKDSELIGNALVNMYARCGALVEAQRVLEELPIRALSAWTALIAGYAERGESQQALKCFERMQHEGFALDAVTFICIIKACGSLGTVDKLEQIHCKVAKQGFLATNLALGTALVDMYAKCGALAKAGQTLEELPLRSVSSWTALITGFTERGLTEQAFTCFERMQSEGLCPDVVTFICMLRACGIARAANKGERVHDEIAKEGLLRDNIVLGISLVDMYAKCGALSKARQVLEELPVRDVVAWTALIAGYTQHGEGGQALGCLEQMQREGLYPDAVTFVCILKACGSMGAVDKGEEIHEVIAKQGLLGNWHVLGNALVDMYAKCGALEKARRVLEELPVRNVVAWTALIAGFVLQCKVPQALTCFEQMQSEGPSPEAATFSCVLSACSRSGLEGDAQLHFLNMSTAYGVNPTVEHYTCMVDLFGRAGQLHKAATIFEISQSCYSAVWLALMSACRRWGGMQVGRWAFEHATELDKSIVVV